MRRLNERTVDRANKRSVVRRSGNKTNIEYNAAVIIESRLRTSNKINWTIKKKKTNHMAGFDWR